MSARLGWAVTTHLCTLCRSLGWQSVSDALQGSLRQKAAASWPWLQERCLIVELRKVLCRRESSGLTLK